MNTEYDRVQYEEALAYEAECLGEDPEETYRLALESANRWLNRYNLSPAMRLRALRSVVEAALSDGP